MNAAQRVADFLAAGADGRVLLAASPILNQDPDAPILEILHLLLLDRQRAQERIHDLERTPLYSNRMKVERLAPTEAPNGAPVSFGWKVGWVADQFEEARAKLEEARLEIAAHRGEPEGGLPGWEWDGQNSRWLLHPSEECWAWTHRCAREEDGWFWCSRGVTERYADTPRKAMRAAEDALRYGGLLP